MTGPRIGALFAGYGGLEMGVQAVLGGTVAWHSEIDPAPSTILAHQWPDTPNHGDITTIDWATVEPVDILTGGFPCQPVSVAGKRAGTTDERWLFDDILTAIRDLDPPPRLCVFENVPGLLTTNHGDAMARVIEGLASVGYVGRYGVRSAAEVGAPHQRKRIFITTWAATDTSHDGWWQQLTRRPRPAQPRPTDAPAPAPTTVSLLPTPVADHSRGLPSTGTDYASLANAAAALLPTPSIVDVEGGRKSRSGDRNDELLLNGIASEQRFGKYQPAITRWETVLGRTATEPTEPTGRDGTPRLSPAFVEFLMGLPAGHVTAVPGLTRNAQLKALGNGVVPQQATAAIRDLLDPTRKG